MARAIVLGMLCLLGACDFAGSGGSFHGGGGGPVAGGGGLGATPGGAKDINQARAVVAAGQVPTADRITVEGLISQHDIPISGAPCSALFCVRPEAARAPSLATGQDALWVTLGMASDLDPARWQRPPLDVIAVVDGSSSMSIDIAQVDAAVAAAIDHLGANDRFGEIVANDQITDRVAFGAIADVAATKSAVLGVGASGNSRLLDGIDRAYQLLSAAHTAGRNQRVLVFTCGYPVRDQLVALSQPYADRGIGLSLFGVLLSFDADLAQATAELRGGNFYFLGTLDEVQNVFNQDFDFVVTPLAYDLDLKLALAGDAKLTAAFGVPGQPSATSTELAVRTVFPSHDHGAIVLELGASDPTALGSVSLSYASAPDLTPGAGSAALGLHASAPAGQPAYDGPGVHTAVVLVIEAMQLQAACAAWWSNDQAYARVLADALVTYLQSEKVALGDPSLAMEVALAQQLRANMK
jgi:Ca-activated chloride channel family protein